MAKCIHLIVDSRHYAGIESHVFHLSSMLRDKALDVQVVLLNDYGPHPLCDKLAERTIPVLKLDGQAKTLWRYIRAIDPQDVIHTHGYKAGILCRLFGVVARRQVVSTYHCGDRGKGLMAIYTWLDKFTQRLSNNIAVSEEINRWLGNSAVVLDNFVCHTSAVFNPNRAARKLAFVGRFSYEKGPDNFVKLAEAFEGDTSLSFTMFGDGPMAGYIKQDAPSNTKLMGFCADLEQHWPDIDGLVISSRKEGMPMVAIEAMMRGIPVIAAPCGALPELLGEGYRGWLANSSDAEDLIAALDQWRRSSKAELREVTARARAHAIQCCSGEQQWSQLKVLYAV